MFPNITELFLEIRKKSLFSSKCFEARECFLFCDTILSISIHIKCHIIMKPILTEEQKIEILRLNAVRFKQSVIAKKIKCNQGSVSRIISKYRTHKTIQRLPGSGNKRFTNPRTDRYMKLTADRDEDTSL